MHFEIKDTISMCETETNPLKVFLANVEKLMKLLLIIERFCNGGSK
jgi:hypothetical protein